jgi:flagellar assembly protein FliH
MAATNKFLFNTTFDDPRANAADDEFRRVKRHTAADLTAARAAGVEEGRMAGQAAALAGVEASSAKALTAAAEALAALGAKQAQAAQVMMEAGLQLAAAIACKAAPETAHRHGLEEIEALVASCLGELVQEPRVVIRVRDELLDTVQARTEALARQAGFEGKLVLVADPSLAAGDVKVEWADGGVVRNLKRLLAEIDATVARALNKASIQPDGNASQA